MRRSERFTSLDGLRGVAALVVLVYHCMLTSPTIFNAVENVERAPRGSWEWWVTYTPLHTFWLGPEAVYIFFILSGFVLTGPALRPAFRWLSYYPKRLLRLYLPVWASLAFAALAVLVVPRTVTAGMSTWTNKHQGATPVNVGIEATLLLPNHGLLNGPLWSLTWEVWFSLLLPVYVIVAKWAQGRTSRAYWIVPALFAVMASAAFTIGAARFLPMFALGVLMYVYRDELQALGRRIDARRGLWPLLAALCVILLTSVWMLQVADTPRAILSSARLLQIAGAALVIFLALCWPPMKRGLDASALQWLGARSFSLYLTHDPI